MSEPYFLIDNISPTVVVSTSYMTPAWSKMMECVVKPFRTVADYVAAGGSNYNLLSDNCNDASYRMISLCMTDSEIWINNLSLILRSFKIYLLKIRFL